jgi:transcriptional regulator with XRE-family HTH domain
MSQTEFAALGGASKRAQIRYESGERSPDAEYLAGIAARGADVLYIVTGKRAEGVT